jgi:hypothetical protein
LLPQFALAKQGLNPRKIFSRRAQFGDGFGLSRRELKAETEYLLGQLVLPRGKFGRILIAHFLNPAGH